MAVKVLELHHHGIRVGPSAPEVKKALSFYQDVLGLNPDPGRPTIPSIDGYWMDPRPGFIWVQPRWEYTVDGYVYVPGAWVVGR